MAETRRPVLPAHLHHRSGAYLFDRADGEDSIAQRFFTGGVMPSHHLIRQYADLFGVEKEWRWSGVHYQRTAQDWLENFDSHRVEIERVLRKVHGDETALWMRRWRWFFSPPQACSVTPTAASGASAITG
jgi:cyclopropane-fatty-acyl-phospholipid synthase